MQKQPARCPALLVAAPASGQGKTTVVAALARLHARQGKRVRVFKCGPDFLDPHWHQLASGAPVHSLDLWINGEADCAARLHEAANHADLVLIEGVMGLFDGDPSAADLARRFGVPVLAVVDASAMAGTFGALAFGLRHYQADLPWAGVLANRVVSDRHADMLRGGLREPGDWLGALPRLAVKEAGASQANVGTSKFVPLLPERHLGLVAAHELTDAMARLDAAADALAALPLGQLSEADWQRWSVTFSAPAGTPEVPTLLAGRTVAVARDAAFSFIYAANLETLVQLGATLQFFSPLAGDGLPSCDAVWLPGGYPELHAAAIAHNLVLRDGLSAHLRAGKALWAECGGMLALFDSLTLHDGTVQPMWGLLPGDARMQSRIAALGSRQFEWHGEMLRGHSFHYSTAESQAPVAARIVRPDAGGDTTDQAEPLFEHGSLRASYVHAWFASNPLATARLFGALA